MVLYTWPGLFPERITRNALSKFASTLTRVRVIFDEGAYENLLRNLCDHEYQRQLTEKQTDGWTDNIAD